MSKETRIGILTVLVIGASIWGYKFIKGQNLLSTQQFFYVEFENVGQMQPSSPVYNRGYQVGTVTDIYPKTDDPFLVVIEMEVANSFKIPKNTIAEINQTVMGDKSIELKFNKICSGADCAQSGDKLQGVFKSVAGSMMTPNELQAYMVEVTKSLKDVTAQLTQMTNDPNNPVGKSMADLQVTMANLKGLTGKMNREFGNNGKVNSILGNVDQLSASIEPDKMKSIIGNANDITEKIKGVDMQGLSDKTNQTMEEAQAAVAKLTATMEKAEGAIMEFNNLLAGINKGEGSLGKLAHDDALYDDLKAAAASANILMLDLQQRPNRYIPFKSGRKVRRIDRKNPLVLPEEEKAKKN